MEAEAFYFSWLTEELSEEELAALIPLLDKLHNRSRNERWAEFVHILADYGQSRQGGEK